MDKEKSKKKPKKEYTERSAIEVINDLADKAMEFTSRKVEELENKLS